MAIQVTPNGVVWEVSIASNGDVYVLVEYNGYLEMWKKTAAGSSFSNVGTNQYYTTVHGKKGTAIGSACMDIDSTDVLHVVDYPIPAGVTIDLAYNTFDTSTDTWGGTWVEIAAVDTAYSSNYPTLNVDGNDDIWVIWGNNDKTYGIWVTTNQSGSWATTQIDDGTNVPIFPRMVVDSAGTVHAWYLANTTGVNCYRYWTSGSGWSSLDSSKTGGTRYEKAFMCKAIADGTDAWICGNDPNTPYNLYRQLEGGDAQGPQTDGTTAFIMEMGVTAEWVTQTIVGGNQYMAWPEDNENQIWVAEWSGSGNVWEVKWVVGDGTGYTDVGRFAYSPHNANYTTLHIVYHDSGIYYEELYGTPTSDTQVAFLAGGGTPSDDIPAFTSGGYNTSSISGFMEGFTDGVSVIHASMLVKDPSIPAYLEGTENWYTDVVLFTAPTSTGTQDITGSLGGLEPSLVFLTGWGATADATVTDDARIFFGWTDGTNEGCWSSYVLDNNTGSSSNPNGGFAATRSAGLWYSSGGAAVFNQWLTNGVQLDWTSASGIGAYQCAALMIATDNPSGIQTYYAADNVLNAEAGDTFDFTDVGFKPDLILFWKHQGGAGFSLGVAQKDFYSDDVIANWVNAYAYNSGYFNYPGVCNRTDTCIADGIDSPSASVARFRVSSFLPNGFQLYSINGDGIYDTSFFYLAIKFNTSVFRVATGRDVISGSPDSVLTPFRVTSVMGTHDVGTACNYPTLSASVDAIGTSMFDASNQASGGMWIGYGGTETLANSVKHSSRAIYQEEESGVIGDATLSTLDSNGFTFNPVTNGSDMYWIAFGYGYDLTSRIHAYMFADTDFVPAHLWGQVNTSSSLSAFFHVVDAQDNIHCYMDGNNPERSNKPAFTQGTDSVVIAVAEFTCSTTTGTQDITTTELGGLTPKAALFIIGPTDSADNSDDNLKYTLGYGFTDGTDEVAVSKSAMNDTSIYYANAGAIALASVIVVNPASTSIDATAVFSSWITNGVRINWTNASTYAFKAKVILFAGTSVSVDFVTLAMPASAGEQTVSIGFEPDVVLGASLYTYEDEATFPLVDKDNRIYFGWGVNDGTVSGGKAGRQDHLYHDSHSGSAVQACYAVGRMSSWNYYTEQIRANLYITEYNASGFKIYSPASSGDELHFLAIRFDSTGRRKAFGGTNVEYERTTGITQKLTQQPTDFSVLPEVLFAYPWKTYDYPDSHKNGASHALMGPAYSKGFMANQDGSYYDCHTQYWDQVCKSRQDTTYNFRIREHSSTNFNWYDTVVANVAPIKNGVEFLLNSYDSDPSNPYQDDPPTLAFFGFGLAEYFSSIPAYMKGQKVNWPSRLPRGAYLEGDAIPVDSSIPAFMQVINTSSIPGFIEGYEPQASTKAGFARGSIDTSGSTLAFLYGKVLVTDSVSGYTEGQSYDVSFTFHGFAKGKSTATDNVNGYCAGSPSADSFWSAYLAGTMGQETVPAYAYGEPLRSTTNAYLDGFSYDVEDSTPAYAEGATFFPFTDDFTGTDEDPWNISKWLIEEDGSGL